MPRTVLITLQKLFHLVFMVVLQSRYHCYHPHSTQRETEAHRNQAAFEGYTARKWQSQDPNVVMWLQS